MKTIDYECHLFNEPITYQLVQYRSGESYQLYHGNTLIGSVMMVGNKCVQISGRQVTEEMLDDICKLI